MEGKIRELLGIIGNPASSSHDLKKASKILSNECFNQAASIPGLLQIISQESNDSVRQLAAVEVRKIIQKEDGAYWEALDLETRENIKSGLLSMAINEKSNLVRHSLAHVISVTANNELQKERWGELVSGLYQICTSENPGHREIGVYVLYSLFDVIADKMENYIPDLMNLFSKLICDNDSLMVAVTTVQALGKIADFVDEQDNLAIQQFQNLVPSIVAVLQRCIDTGDDEGVGKIFEVFDDLLLLEAPLLAKHFVELIKLFLSIAASQNNEEQVRVQALSFLMWSIMSAKGKIGKSRLINPILSAVFKIAAEEEPESRDEDYPAKLAIQVINTLATTYSPQQVFPDATQLIVNGLRSAEAGDRKASMLSIAVLVEGCAEYMRNHLKDILEMVVMGMKDSSIIVRRAACMALGALCDDFEDEISAEHATLMPIIFSIVSDNNQSIHSEALSTLDVMIENLGSEILPYASGLMNCLMQLWNSNERKVQIATTNCIGSVAFASSNDFMPFFEPTIARLSILLTLNDPKDLALRSVATDCIGAVAAAVGKDVFRPYLASTMNTVIQGTSFENSQLKQCSYVLFGVLGKLFEEEFAPYLQVIVPPILQSCIAQDQEFDARELEIGEDDEDRPTFASGIAQEKESSVDTLGELFSATKGIFMPYVPDSINTALGLLDHYHESVRISTAGCLLKFFSTAYSMTNPGDWESGLPLKVALHENVANIGKLAMEGVLLLLADEDERMVVTQCLQLISETIKIVGPAAFSQQFSGENPAATGSHLDMLANQLLLILRAEHPCQISDDMDGYDDENEEDIAELDALVLSSAADTVSAISSAVGPQFAHYFKSFLPLIGRFYKPNKLLADRSMAIGALAEVVDGLESGVTPFTNDLMNLFLKALVDEEEEVRSNAAFGVGVLCAHSQSDVVQFYPRILQLLHPFFINATVTNAKDNACGALCRMILVAPQSIPLEQAVPLILDCLPLTKDFEENRPVYAALLKLLNEGHVTVQNELPRIMKIFSTVLSPENASQLHDSTREAILQFAQKS